ncbi:hypothetical protein IJ556_03265 [bacterium]|nr:hypothetical protein [bacterium]
MALLAVILILIVWGIIVLKQAVTPSNPPIDYIQEHCRIIQSLPNQKARQKYLKDLAKRK